MHFAQSFSRYVLVSFALLALMAACHRESVKEEAYRTPEFAAAPSEAGKPRQTPLTEVPCKEVPREKLLVLVVFGQSNSANFGQPPLDPQDKRVLMFFDGACYEAKDPLAGAGGLGGSVWTRLGKKIVESGRYDRVLLVALGQGGTPIDAWSSGLLLQRLLATFRELQAADFTPTHILFHQGETDAQRHTPAENYKRELLTLVRAIRTQGTTAPFYIVQASRCYAWRDEAIAQAQRETVGPDFDVHLGPNADAIPDRARYDGCHLGGEGLDLLAAEWMQTLFPAHPGP